MRMKLVAVGRAKAGPERDLCSDYLTRAEAFGRQIGLNPIELVEVEGANTADEGKAVLRAAGNGLLILLDERSKELDSWQFVTLVECHRDDGIWSWPLAGPTGTGPTAPGRPPERGFRPDDLAAHAGSDHGRRTNLPDRDNPVRAPLLPSRQSRLRDKIAGRFFVQISYMERHENF